ncbi:hypothetical protein N7527_003614 [Penicillium freii]|uniref:Uncharacterized protein n=1 Tax=Penicillium freii TaxID=48697 RepID=A0A101MEP4_PENFR|nr:hypothetical protein N7527_003614 [Penicillium freii]KUM59214.1 hypothetical protein ACN42_g7929 [Penicillium freii]
MTRKRSHEIDGHDYISYEVHLGSFSAAVPATTLCVNTREVPMEPIRSFDRNDTENSPTISAPKSIVSVWLIFLYGLVEGYILGSPTDDSEYRCLEEFLNQDVDQDVRFVGNFAFSETNKPAENDQNLREDSGESDERVVFDLVESLELGKLFSRNFRSGEPEKTGQK